MAFRTGNRNRVRRQRIILTTVVYILSPCIGFSPNSHFSHATNVVGDGHGEIVGITGCPLSAITPSSNLPVASPASMENANKEYKSCKILSSLPNRRSFLDRSTGLVTAMAISTTALTFIDQNSMVLAATQPGQPEITSKIFLQVKGLSDLNRESSPSTVSPPPDRIVIGLFGKQAPQPTQILTQLFSSQGYPAECKPRETRTLQREQLETNKVYNACIGSTGYGVTYDLSTVWRVIKDERIDLGAVSGKFASREAPMFEVEQSNEMVLKHDREGVVSVRRGNNGGFGFTIFPGDSDGAKGASRAAMQLDKDNIIVGQVLDGMDVVRRLNEIPVVRSAGASIMSGGSASKRSAPSRACRYGGSESYCSEFKPLKKILISDSGVL